MHLAEAILDKLAPHICIQCGREGRLLCKVCQKTLPKLHKQCYRCGRATTDSLLCNTCSTKTPLASILCDVEYAGTARRLIHAVKFENARAGCHTIAQIMSTQLASLPAKIVIVPVPTTNRRHRQRGYDQAEQIAKEISRITGLPFARLLERHGSTHQVGASRNVRTRQITGSFTVRSHIPALAAVILVDDVLTTGATIEEAARTLHAASVAEIHAAVFAYTAPLG